MFGICSLNTLHNQSASYIIATSLFDHHTTDILQAVLGLPTECLHHNKVRPCRLSLSCWLQGGKHAHGCGDNRWLFSCCITDTESTRPSLSSLLPSSLAPTAVLPPLSPPAQPSAASAAAATAATRIDVEAAAPQVSALVYMATAGGGNHQPHIHHHQHGPTATATRVNSVIMRKPHKRVRTKTAAAVVVPIKRPATTLTSTMPALSVVSSMKFNHNHRHKFAAIAAAAAVSGGMPKKKKITNVLRRRTDDHKSDGNAAATAAAAQKHAASAIDCGVARTAQNTIQKRIIGGRTAQFAEFPWQAHIRIAEFQCGGVLVARQFIATAAHCIQQARVKDIVVYLGELDTQNAGAAVEPLPAEKHRVVKKLVHPRFQFRITQPDRYDLALLQMATPTTYK